MVQLKARAAALGKKDDHYQQYSVEISKAQASLSAFVEEKEELLAVALSMDASDDDDRVNEITEQLKSAKKAGEQHMAGFKEGKKRWERHFEGASAAASA